jgi:tetratricopeptide (TPR) repeat protein
MRDNPPLMRVGELVAALQDLRPEAVPATLAEAAPFVLSARNEVEQHLRAEYARTHQSSVATAGLWLELASVTEGAFWEEGALSRFGRAFLEYATLAGVRAEPQILARDGFRDVDWTRLALALEQRRTADQNGALLQPLAHLTGCALRIIPRQQIVQRMYTNLAVEIAKTIRRASHAVRGSNRANLLELGTQLCELADAAVPSGSVERGHLGQIWADLLVDRSEAPGGDIGHLEVALSLHERAVTDLGHDMLSQARCRMTWANALAHRYEFLGYGLRDLEQALQLYRDAAKSLPEGSVQMAHCRMNQANTLALRQAARGGTAAHMDQALQAYALAARDFPVGSLEQARCWVNWAGVLERRYESSRRTADLDEAVDLLERAAVIFAEYPDRLPGCQATLANVMAARAAALGDSLSQTERALELFATAARGLEAYPFELAKCQQNWATTLMERSKLSGGQLSHLRAAIGLFEQAEKGLAGRPIEQAQCRMNLGIALAQRYESSGRIEDLQHTLRLLDLASAVFPEDSALQRLCRSNRMTAQARLDAALGRHN